MKVINNSDEFFNLLKENKGMILKSLSQGVANLDPILNRYGKHPTWSIAENVFKKEVLHNPKIIRFSEKIFIKDYKNTTNPEVRFKYGIFASVFGIITNILLFIAKKRLQDAIYILLFEPNTLLLVFACGQPITTPHLGSITSCQLVT